MALEDGARITALAALSGFMPLDAEEIVTPGLLQGKPVFIAHGTQDDLVPVDRARSAAAILEKAGAQVTLCEDEVGHKLSLGCFQSLEAFFHRYMG
jgi:phospholipase/carboxylesterase